jgi:hypothetical protein
MFYGLAASYPPFAQILEGHIFEYREIIPHVLAGDLSSLISDLASSEEGVSVAVSVINDIGRFGEDGDEELRNVISVSIIENLIGRNIGNIFTAASNEWILSLYSKILKLSRAN